MSSSEQLYTEISSKSNYFTLNFTAEQLGIKPGQRRYLPRVRLTLEADWECSLAITWTRATVKYPAELCVVMTNLHADGWVLRHELKRMHIEESFRDDKSGGFDLDASRLTDPKRLDALLLALAIAVLWMYALGEKYWMTSSGEQLTLATSDNSVSSNMVGDNYIGRWVVVCRWPFLWHSIRSNLNLLGIVLVNQGAIIMIATVFTASQWGKSHKIYVGRDDLDHGRA
jgi:hypothetical protein